MAATMMTGAPREQRMPRVIGTYDTGREGTTFVVTGGIHGNEPAGLIAGRNVLRKLAHAGVPLRGSFLVLAGNLGALEQKVRYRDQDLNRLWTPRSVADLRSREPMLDTLEQAEQRELLAEIEKAIERSDGRFALLDLHSSSGDGAPFVCMGDTLSNRKIAFALPLPVILGLEETIDGALLDWLYETGRVALAIEGGRHDDEETAKNLEASVWLSLVAAECLTADEVPAYAEHERQLTSAARGIARVLEIRHREVLEPTDLFRMEPGFTGFDRVERGQLLATKNGAEVRATEHGRMLLPLYQGQGSDGFFIARRVRRFWLRLSAVLRRMRMSRLLPLLPGISCHPSIPDAFVGRYGRLFENLSVNFFHLLGFRRRRRDGEVEVFTRRREG
ncbi:MAG: succinylglutamate desuccinylase/aspartoacylase family protein [Planctomycetes bacterium]|nr:succinylglutamate desuccinylase/aspartoacylase family protein [Planctomycetota bacterium]